MSMHLAMSLQVPVMHARYSRSASSSVSCCRAAPRIPHQLLLHSEGSGASTKQQQQGQQHTHQRLPPASAFNPGKAAMKFDLGAGGGGAGAAGAALRRTADTAAVPLHVVEQLLAAAVERVEEWPHDLLVWASELLAAAAGAVLLSPLPGGMRGRGVVAVLGECIRHPS